MSDRFFPKTSSEKIMTLKEAAKYLHTSYSTVYRLVMEGELDAFRLRTGWRTSTAACEAFVKRRFADHAKDYGQGSQEAMIP